MPNVKFLLKEPKSAKETLIYLFFIYYNNRFKYSTGLTILPKNWNAKAQKARENKSFVGYSEFNSYLNRLSIETQNFYRQSITNGFLPTISDFKNHLDKNVTFRAKLDPIKEKPSLMAFFAILINEKKNTLSINTIKTHETTLNHLKSYIKSRKIILDYESINFEFLSDFSKFMYDPPYELSTNTLSKYIKSLKMVLNEATEREYNNYKLYQNSKFTVKTEKVHDIYLTQSEVDAIYYLDLTSQPKGYETVRDLFIIGCCTGLRFSDWHRVRKDQIQTMDGKEVLTIITEKTHQTVSFPIHRYIKELLTKYDNKLPKPLSNQKTNDYLKDIGQWAGITQTIILPTSKAGKREDKEKFKYEHISTHTARRSFATNAYLAGIDSLLIMSITGHTTEREFLKYIKISAEQKAVKMADNSFFKR